MNRPPFPPFTAETAAQKTRMAEDAWNTRNPAEVALAYTINADLNLTRVWSAPPQVDG